jgi:hypothetical protein
MIQVGVREQACICQDVLIEALSRPKKFAPNGTMIVDTLSNIQKHFHKKIVLLLSGKRTVEHMPPPQSPSPP